MACCGKGMHPRPARERQVLQKAVRPQTTSTTIDGTKEPAKTEETTTIMASRKAFTTPTRK